MPNLGRTLLSISRLPIRDQLTIIHKPIINNWSSGLPPQVLKVPYSPYLSPLGVTVAVLGGPSDEL